VSGRIRLGTSSWSAKEWIGPFYPPGTRAADFLGEYAKVFDAVEADTTYYGVPTRDMVFGWRRRTPEGFTMAAKFPRSVCHGGTAAKPDPAKILDLEATAKDRDAFLSAMFVLADRCGPLLLQFPYFNKTVFATKKPFLERLDRYLSALPPDFRYAVEIRNKSWIGPDFLDLLRRHGAAFVLVDQAWMPHADELPDRLDPLTADFSYIRLLGDRPKIEAITKTWDREVIDHGERLARWAEVIRRLAPRASEVFVFANNHYAGHAPATVRRLKALLSAPSPPKDQVS
jgi:uncharacterized protein YecE (DUF72 family)